jgi:hypothetical protein
LARSSTPPRKANALAVVGWQSREARIMVDVRIKLLGSEETTMSSTAGVHALVAEASATIELAKSMDNYGVVAQMLAKVRDALSDAVAEREAEPVDDTDAERLSRMLGPSVDGQVVVAALEDGDYVDQPEWLWRNHTTSVCGFGRWSKALGQAPYIRADIALAALAASPPTSELEALRKRVAELEREKRDAFNHGYVIACCNISNLHNDEVIAHDVLANLGVAKHEVVAMDLSEYDLTALKKIEKCRSQSPYAARRVREGGKVE